MGKGGGTTQSTGTTYTTNIPEYAEPYVMNMLNATQEQLFTTKDVAPTYRYGEFGELIQTGGGGKEITGFKEYKPYSSNANDYVASFSPMQEQAMRTAASPEAFGQQVQGYMSPYMQNVVDIQKREAMRGAGILGAQQQAQATNAGAFGGYREGIQRSENQRNLMTQMNDIQLKGQQMAFDNAQQQARMSQGQQMQYGGMQQQLEQQKINQRIQDFANAQQYPLMQLGTMSNMLRGLPMQAQTTNQYVAAPNPISQGIGAAGTYASLQNAGVFGKPAGAAGGLPSEFKYAEGGVTSVPSYDVGGEVESTLENMDIQGLMKQAQESSSPTVRAMAKRILRERQMEGGADRGAAPTGPMGIDYQAAQGMAGGGIIAFQSGKEVTDPDGKVPDNRSWFEKLTYGNVTPAEKARMGRLESQAEARRATPTKLNAERDAAMAEVNRPNPNVTQETLQRVGLVPPPAPEPEQQVIGRTPTPAPAAGPAAAPTKAAAGPAAPRASAPAKASAPAEDAGIVAARLRQSPDDGAMYDPGPNAAPAAPTAEAPAGIMAAAPKDSKPVFSGPLAAAEKAAYEAQQEANLSDAEYLKRVKAGQPENVAAAELRKKIMDERANSEAENERQRQMRLAQFFSKWGSTPGPVLAAGLQAMEKTLPDIISDEAGFKKAKRELDKVIFDIDNATRLEELGNIKDARALKEKAADRAMQLNQTLSQAKSAENTARIQQESSKYTADTNVRIAEIREKSEALNRSAARATADDNKKFSQFQSATQQEMLVNQRVAAEENGKQHLADVKLINDAKLMKPADMPEGYADKIAAAKGRIETREKGWNSQLENAKRNTELAFSRVRVAGPAASENTPPPAATAPRTMTRADVEATAKAQGKTVAEVEAAAKAKNVKIVN